MKKILLLVLAIAATACSQHWNDLVHERVVAGIEAFEIEGQLSCELSRSGMTVTVTMPEDTDLGALRVAAFTYTETATLSREVAVGSVLDLTSPMELTLTNYGDEYVWTITAVNEQKPQRPDDPDIPDGPGPDGELTPDGPQLYNMGFDLWSEDEESEILMRPYAEDATDEQKAVWASGGDTFALLGAPTVRPEYEFVYAEGEGKAALRLESLDLMDSGAFVYGAMFTGSCSGANLFSRWSLVMQWGTPFTARPAALEGYVCYKPQTITLAEAPYEDEEGQTDKAHVLVLLTDWEAPVAVYPPDQLVDYSSDAVIGYGKVVFDQSMEGYQRFQANISYRSDRTPTHIVISAASSTYGDFFTGAPGSVLYLDELALLYEKKSE